MQRGKKKLVQKVIAVIVIVAILDVIGVPPAIMIFFVGVGFLVWRAARRAEYQETERVFDFYVAADEILREKERQWYGFEIAEVINRGEQLLTAMGDPPPLSLFALGALYHRAGDYHHASQYLASIIEDSASEERLCRAPSPQLRRYVEVLRHMEREPASAPETVAAIRSLERARRKSAQEMLAECRQYLAAEGGAVKPSHTYPVAVPSGIPEELSSIPGHRVNAPPPIAEVLHNVYEEEQKTA
jgi:cbb3-type cytochrome oxidase subunit 3